VEIVRTLHDSVTDSDFVAIGNRLDGTESNHSALIIQFRGTLLEFHYPGRMELNHLQKDYFHIVTSTIPDYEVPSFISMCRNILKKANPRYGFFYSGESYDVDGNHRSNTDLGETMTCVGFCLNVLNGFVEDEYLAYWDWDHTSHPEPNYLRDYCTKYNIDMSKVQDSHRRITPSECLISCFFADLPIRKADIDSKQQEVQQHFNSVFGNNF
jgi:hypothetical protein